MNSSVPTWMRWRIVALLIAFSFMSWFNRLSMAAAYDTSIRTEYGISKTAIGTVYSAFFLSYTLFMTPGGWFIDRFGAKLSLIIMGLGSGLFGALTGVAGLPALTSAGLMIAALLVIRLSMGLLSAPVYPAASRLVAAWVPWQQRTLANGLIQAAAGVGMACAFPLFGAMVDVWDWPTAFAVSGSLTICLGLAWWYYAADHPPVPREMPAAETAIQLGMLAPEAEIDIRAGRPSRALESANRAGQPPVEMPLRDTAVKEYWVTVLKNRNVLLVTLSYGAVGYLEYLFFFWMNNYFETVLHLENSRIFSAILFLAMAAGMVFGGWIAGRLGLSYGPWMGRALVPMVGMTLGALFLGLGVISAEVGWIVFWLALAIFAVGATEAPTWTAAVELGGRQGGTAAGIVNTGGNLGGMIAPTLTPLVSEAVRDYFDLSEKAGWQWGIALGGIICLSGAALWWWIRPED